MVRPVPRYKIKQDAWNQATLVLLRYLESKAEMREIVTDMMARDPETRGRGSKQPHADPTAAAGERLYFNTRYQRLKREVKAVDDALEGMTDIEKDVIKRRFWEHSHGYRSPCPYEYMIDLGYERRQMQRIIRKAIIRVAVNLGEL